MPITEDELIDGIEQRLGYPLDAPQKQAIKFGTGPLLIAAGPGTGKTEVLVSRSLKLMCCDGVKPGSIFLTTFTEKAAQSLLDRVTASFLFLRNLYPALNDIDPSELRIGTLHGLSNDILQKYRYTAYQNLRLLDDVESALLIHRKLVPSLQKPTPAVLNSIVTQFRYLYGNKPQLSKWDHAMRLRDLFGRLVEDRIDRSKLTAAGGAWAALEQALVEYENVLAETHACDFPFLLKHFRDFLDSGQGNLFLAGDGTDIRLPLLHVLVDEYQDTNPIQEDIYLRLCAAAPHNITVVGDDDQALYRFRGGTVECMVGFAAACQSRFGVTPTVIYLKDNHRSDSEIVQWCNTYITAYPQMTVPNARIAGKPPLDPALGRTGTHPAVSHIRAGTIPACATAFATLITELKTNGVIADYSQCVLLLRSTKNTPNNAGKYIAALQAANIPIYNPRSKDFLEQEEVAQCLGAFIRIVDRDLFEINKNMSPAIRQLVLGWVSEYDAIASAHPALADYVTKAANKIATSPVDEQLSPATPTILYRILAHEPFVTYQGSPNKDLRLSKITRLFEAFCAQYGRGLYTDNTAAGRVSGYFLNGFYYGYCGYLSDKGIDDDEDDEAICPTGYFPIMTFHQAKGLEFDFVFVGTLAQTVSSNNAHQLEVDFRPYRQSPPSIVHSIADAQWHDEIRQHYVAFSRAKNALILIASDSQFNAVGTTTASFGPNGGSWVKQNTVRV
jgi:DNA helicase-2/ATP-dependent DNA helicase PcrA